MYNNPETWREMKPSDNRPIAGGNSQYGFVPTIRRARLRISPIENNIFLPSEISGDQLLVLRAAVEHEVGDVSGEATAVN